MGVIQQISYDINTHTGKTYGNITTHHMQTTTTATRIMTYQPIQYTTTPTINTNNTTHSNMHSNTTNAGSIF